MLIIVLCCLGRMLRYLVLALALVVLVQAAVIPEKGGAYYIIFWDFRIIYIPSQTNPNNPTYSRLSPKLCFIIEAITTVGIMVAIGIRTSIIITGIT